jgi:DNA-binding transcriptional LysR family regulator
MVRLSRSRIFEELHFARAAERLHSEQSPLSRAIKELDQAKTNVQAAASGYHGTLRIALSDALVSQRLPALLAVCREQEPDVDIRLFAE